MAAEITLVRHAETEANAAGRWQGNDDAPLTASGTEQVKRLGDRLQRERFDLVVSSDLGRARSSALATGVEPEIDRRWREMELGAWEGHTSTEISELFGDDLAALRRGEDLPFGGGERMSEFLPRIVEAFDELAMRLDDGQRALVMTHGGVMHTLSSHVLGVNLRGRALRVTNTALNSYNVTEYGTHVAVYNDATHLPDAPLRLEGAETHLVLVRHGETEANVAGRWQGHADGPLTAEGRRQAGRVAGEIPPLDAVYTSPLVRAHHTAASVGVVADVEPIVRGDLKEIGFGRVGVAHP